jgi:hypothetical protein
MAPFREDREDASGGVQGGGAQKGGGKGNERKEDRKAEEKEDWKHGSGGGGGVKGATVREKDDLYWQVTMKERISNHFIGSLTAQEQRWGPHSDLRLLLPSLPAHRDDLYYRCQLLTGVRFYTFHFGRRVPLDADGVRRWTGDGTRDGKGGEGTRVGDGAGDGKGGEGKGGDGVGVRGGRGGRGGTIVVDVDALLRDHRVEIEEVVKTLELTPARIYGTNNGGGGGGGVGQGVGAGGHGGGLGAETERGRGGGVGGGGDHGGGGGGERPSYADLVAQQRYVEECV